MASFHFAMKNGKCGNGARHAEYITREGQYSRGERAEDLVYKEHGNMPSWAENNPQDFWRAADQYERANGRVYTEMEIDLPNELTRDQQIQLVKDFVQDQLGDSHTYSFAIHEKNATLAPEHRNPHAHIMFSERKLDGIERDREQHFKRANTKNPELGGTAKDREWNRRDKPYEIREAWAEIQNKALEREGHSVRVDPRTLAAQREDALQRGDMEAAERLDRTPERHLGPKSNNANHPDVIDLMQYRHIKEKIAELKAELQLSADKVTVADLRKTLELHRLEIQREINGLDGQIRQVDERKKELALAYRPAAVDKYIRNEYDPKWAAWQKNVQEYTDRLQRYENAGFLAKMKSSYAEEGKELLALHARLVREEKELKAREENHRRELDQPGSRADGSATVGFVADRMAQARDPEYAEKVAQLEREKKPLHEKREALRASLQKTDSLLNTVRRVPDQNQAIKISADRRRMLEEAEKVVKKELAQKQGRGMRR